MRTARGSHCRSAFGRAIALVWVLGLMLCFVHAAVSTTLDVGWLSEAQSGESGSRFGTESSDCRILPTAGMRSRARQIPLVHVPRAAIQAVRPLLPTVPFAQYPSRISSNPAWTPPLRC